MGGAVLAFLSDCARAGGEKTTHRYSPKRVGDEQPLLPVHDQTAVKMAAHLHGRHAGQDRLRAAIDEPEATQRRGPADPSSVVGCHVDGTLEGLGPECVGRVEVRVGDDDCGEAAFGFDLKTRWVLRLVFVWRGFFWWGGGGVIVDRTKREQTGETLQTQYSRRRVALSDPIECCRGGFVSASRAGLLQTCTSSMPTSFGVFPPGKQTYMRFRSHGPQLIVLLIPLPFVFVIPPQFGQRRPRLSLRRDVLSRIL